MLIAIADLHNICQESSQDWNKDVWAGNIATLGFWIRNQFSLQPFLLCAGVRKALGTRLHPGQMQYFQGMLLAGLERGLSLAHVPPTPCRCALLAVTDAS